MTVGRLTSEGGKSCCVKDASLGWWPHNLTRSKSVTLRETHFFFNSASQFITSVSG